MYRARAEAVSGTRVYADGKWLRCIGNKCVSVGEYVWTDGRCVYGHDQEAQQPQVITAPQEDEGIPLAAFSTKRADLYTFEKNCVRKVAEIRLESGDANIYNVVGDEFVFNRTLPNTDRWTDYRIFINDGKKSSWLYDKGTHYKAGFYNPTNWSNAENNFYTDTELIGCNVDNSGNRFDMVIRYKSEWIELDSMYGAQEKEIQATAVEILKNGEVVQSVSLGKIFDDVTAATPDTEQLWTPAEVNAYSVSVSNKNLPACAFIENERAWAFWLDCWCTKETLFNDDPPIDTEQTGWRMHSGVIRTSLRQLRLITAGERKIISQTSEQTYATVDLSSVPYVEHYTTSTTNHISRATIPLQDGYYCTVHDIFTAHEVLDLEAEYLNEAVFGYITHFSPRSEELFSGIFLLPYTAQICKIRNKYLFNHGCGASSFLGDETPDVYNGVRVFESGLFLITKNTCERIGNTFSNEQLRPMKNIRGWQNRIGNIELPQKEI